MLDQLKFVQRGVARKDIVPGLQHFRIQGGRVTGFNGTITISAPVDIGFDAAPAAGAFVKALNACEDTISLKLDGLALQVRSGSFRTVVPCIDLAQVPTSVPEGVMVQPPTSILHALEVLEPFIGTDASRPWACGVLLHGQSALATNNTTIVEYWLGTDLPKVNIPSTVLEELLRIKEELVALQVSDSTITFHYGDGRWIKSALLSLEWPDIWRALDQACSGCTPYPVPAGLPEACAKLVAFKDKHDVRVYLRGADISTTKGGLADGGAVVELPGLPDKCCFNTRMLSAVLQAAQGIDFNCYPKPVPFFTDRLRGALLGIRVDYA